MMSPKQIKALRKTLKITQQQLADLVGARRESVARWEIATSRPTGAYLMLLRKLADKVKRKRTR